MGTPKGRRDRVPFGGTQHSRIGDNNSYGEQVGGLGINLIPFGGPLRSVVGDKNSSGPQVGGFVVSP